MLWLINVNSSHSCLLQWLEGKIKAKQPAVRGKFLAQTAVYRHLPASNETPVCVGSTIFFLLL